MAANSMPIPAPPRTPSPISEGNSPIGIGLGLDVQTEQQQPIFDVDFEFNPNSLSPEAAIKAPPLQTGMLSPESIPSFTPTKSPHHVDTPMTSFPVDSADEESSRTPANNPFNFTTQQYAPTTTTTRSPTNPSLILGRRKGHKYKHSSISHQIFQAPPVRAAITLPTSLPLPTRPELLSSLTSSQRLRLAWCAIHLLTAAIVSFTSHGSMSLTALSRLLFFDASGAVVCVAVDILSNFEVWKRSSLRHPFGLERADVLAGFGMAVFIAFMGLDVLSHGIEHALENAGGHHAHTEHGHGGVGAGRVDTAALAAVGVTLVSALGVGNHARIGRAVRVEALAGWGRVASNPSHLLTLGCSVLLLVLPLLDEEVYKRFDAVLSAGIAIAMIAFGARLGTRLASMLLMSFDAPGGTEGVKDVIREIEGDEMVSGVEVARFWQVHYGLGMANLKVRCKASGYGDEMSKVRARVERLIKNRLGGEYGSGGLHWEVSTQLVLDGN